MKTPVELLTEFAPEFAQNQMDERALLFEHPNYQVVPAKYKMLICCSQMAEPIVKSRRAMQEKNLAENKRLFSAGKEGSFGF
jgi:hypothetical protein